MYTLHFSATTIAFFRALIVFVAPAVMLFGHGYHPWIGTPADAGFFERLAAAVAVDPTRWWVSHLMIAVGAGLLMLAFIALRSQLREWGEEGWSALALPFVILGSTLYAILPAMEFAPLGALRAGADAAAVQSGLVPWFGSILLSSAVLFAIGVAGFAVAIARSERIGRSLTWVVVSALVVMAATRFFPLGAAQLYVGPAAGVGSLWPLAYAMWRQGRPGAGSGPSPVD